MFAERFIRENHSKLRATPYEEEFVRKVLARVDGLNWEAVEAQTMVRDLDQGRRFIDFTIVEGDVVRIAIEVDGYDKAGTGPMTRAEFTSFLQRGSDIAARGYRVIRFANQSVMAEPARCARTISLVLKRERALAAELASARNADADVLRQRLLNDAEREELRELRAAHIAAFEALTAHLDEEIARREAAESAREADRQRTTRVGRYFTSVSVAVAVATGLVAFIVTRPGDAPDSAALGASTAACESATPWDEARASIGERATVRGPVSSARFQPGATGRPTFVDLGGTHPVTDRFTVVVWGEDRPNFPAAPEDLYRGKTIAVTGTVTEYRGVPQVGIDSPDAVNVC